MRSVSSWFHAHMAALVGRAKSLDSVSGALAFFPGDLPLLQDERLLDCSVRQAYAGHSSPVEIYSL